MLLGLPSVNNVPSKEEILRNIYLQPFNGKI